MEPTHTTVRSLMPDALCLLVSLYCTPGLMEDHQVTKCEHALLQVLLKMGLVECLAGKWNVTQKGRTHVAACCNLALPVSWPSVFGVPIA